MNCKSIAFFVLLLTVLIVANAQTLCGQGKLARVRDKVRENKSQPKRPETRNDDRKKEDRNESKRHENRNRSSRSRPFRKPKRRRSCDNGLDIVISGLFAPVAETVHVVHHAPSAPALVQQPYVPQEVFVDSVPTTVIEPPSVVLPLSEPIYQEVVVTDPAMIQTDVFDWGVRLSAVGGTDFDDISLGSFGLLLQAPNGLGIDSSVTMLRESGMSFRDQLFLGDVNLVFEPIFQDRFRLRVGIGVNWLGDSYGGDAGFNMTSGFDWKLTNRAIATGEIDFGSIGDTDITHARIGIGRVINPTTEWVVGYDHLDIGGVSIGSGFTGLQFRF